MNQSEVKQTNQKNHTQMQFACSMLKPSALGALCAEPAEKIEKKKQTDLTRN